jgi:sn-glycerol 3-phosphate transport system ATP-binding protein
MRFEIQKLHQRLGTTTLYVTHDQVEAMTLAQRMIVMNAGRAEQIGSPMQVYEDPATQFVAGFIGSPSMNLLAGRSEGGGRIALEHGGAVRHASGTAEAGRAVTVGIRPEHVIPGSESDGLFAATVELVEHLGADTLVHLSHGKDLVVARMPHGSNPAVGSTLHVAADPNHVYMFDAVTGVRMR